jgi:hypothetical protein
MSPCAAINAMVVDWNASAKGYNAQLDHGHSTAVQRKLGMALAAYRRNQPALNAVQAA